MCEDTKIYKETGFLDAESVWEAVCYYRGNLINLIAGQRGWNPLEVWEEMTVSFGNKRYNIVRLADEE